MHFLWPLYPLWLLGYGLDHRKEALTIAAISIVAVISYFLIKRKLESDAFWKRVADEEKKEQQRKLDQEQALEKAMKVQEENARAAEAWRKSERQKSLQTSLTDLCSTSLSIYEEMPDQLIAAETALDQAEFDYGDGAFSPFWSSVQKATTHLAHFNNRVKTLTANSQNYHNLRSEFEYAPPTFPVAEKSVRSMAAANSTADRMRIIVRKAQRNFQFASIYEQRKTNQILVVGFKSLGQALEAMENRIALSLDELSGQISEMSASLANMSTSLDESSTCLNESVADLKTSVEKLHVTTEREAKAQTTRHDRALDMLDNIQRRRIPYPRGMNDGKY